MSVHDGPEYASWFTFYAMLTCLPEYLHVAEYCVGFRKDASWSASQQGGCLGYPAALMMFSIVDAIGSYHRGDRGLSVHVDGKTETIRRDGFQHFYILNSDYYGQTLSSLTIKSLYDNFRSLLVHNAALAPRTMLLHFSGDPVPFPINHGRQCVNVPSFLKLSKQAVGLFLERVDVVVPGSDQAKTMWRKQSRVV